MPTRSSQQKMFKIIDNRVIFLFFLILKRYADKTWSVVNNKFIAEQVAVRLCSVCLSIIGIRIKGRVDALQIITDSIQSTALFYLSLDT